MTHITFRLTAKNRDQLQNPTFGNRVWATFTFLPEDFVGAKFYCPHALAGGNQHIWIREKMLEFSSTELSTLSPYNLSVKM